MKAKLTSIRTPPLPGLVLGVSFFFWMVSCSERSSKIPAVPDISTSTFLPAVRTQVESAYTEVRKNPGDAESSGKLGMLLEAYGQNQAAIACYQRAHLLDARSFRWVYLLGQAYLTNGNSTEAALILREALRLEPQQLPARLALAEALLTDDKHDQALREYEAILKAQPGNALAHYGLGRAYAQKGDEVHALKEYLRATDLFPNYGAAHYAASLILRKQGDAAASAVHLSAYESNKTKRPPVDDPLRRQISALNAGAMQHLRRGAELEQAGKLQEAAGEQEEALTIDPKLLQAHVNLISLYGKLNQFDQAETHYRIAVEMDPNQADAYYNYGVMLFNRDRGAEAEREFRKALRINPHHAMAHHNLGFLLEQRGDLARALAEYELATASQPEYPLAHFHAGRILAARKQYQSAIEHFLKSLTPEDERTPAYLYALAATCARSGNRNEAIKFAHRARNGASALGQTELLASIDKDLAVLERR